MALTGSKQKPAKPHPDRPVGKRRQEAMSPTLRSKIRDRLRRKRGET